ncbi:hypothetical protein GWK47_037531 [Chionoecetes opilio]|uniref:Uncharacterized protein n=1 Tax=Chionoecetes opilio TaxID=41210 RepID=A0A8J5D284_CHIOP|nr:hypothetical protein GWK47_037531 [Chionoecetes opilio]
MGITSPEKMAEVENLNSINLTRSLTDMIIAQDAQGEIDQSVIAEQKKRFSRDRQQGQRPALNPFDHPASRHREKNPHRTGDGSVQLANITTNQSKGFNLNKQEFVDAVALRYGWPVEGLPNTCVCGSPNSADHTMTCKKGGFVCIRHDEVRDLTASMLKEVCHDVSTEPTLLPLDGELLRYRTANTAPEARVDICARGFWTRGQRTLFGHPGLRPDGRLPS